MKRYMNMALLYAALAMVGGVFYRSLPNSMASLPKPPWAWYIHTTS